MNDATLLVTGRQFGGRGLRGVMPVMQELVMSARQDLHLLAYVMTPGALQLVKLIEDALSRGVKLTLVVNKSPDQEIGLRSELDSLAQRFSHAAVQYFQDPEGSQLHAKVLVADRKQAVIGSANFSWGGLIANHEIGVLLKGEQAWELAAMIDSLSRAP